MWKTNEPVLWYSAGQRAVLEDDTTDVLLIGAASGGGKTHTLLSKVLKWAEDPAACIGVFRETWAILKAYGGILETAKAALMPYGATYNSQALQFTMPNGARIKFMSLDNSQNIFLGIRFTHVAIDECQQASVEEVVACIGSILPARPHFKKVQALLTCTPDTPVPCKPRSWVFNLLRDYLNAEGVPEIGDEVAMRFKRVDDNATLSLVKRGSLHPQDMYETFRFIPLHAADIADNVEGMQGYCRVLNSLSQAKRQHFLCGSWTATEE